jgi:16S rRNA (guanine527-N7)-methyltransferase
MSPDSVAGSGTGGQLRAPLPTDVEACPPIEPAFRAALASALLDLDIRLGPAVLAGIEAHVRLLMAWNMAINLTAVRDPEAIALEHVADSLTAIAVIEAADLGRHPALLDLGSGPGYPGLPLGLALPAGHLTLVDSVAKKARFLQVAGDAALGAAAALGLEGPTLEVVADRAESVAHDRRQRGRYDVVTARAVGPLAELVELALPMLRPGGRLVAWKRDVETATVDGAAAAMSERSTTRPDLARELADAERLLPQLGGALERVVRVAVPGLEDHRLIVVRPEHPTPTIYPRSPTLRRRDRA